MKGGSNRWDALDEKIVEAFQAESQDIKAFDYIKSKIDERIRLSKIESIKANREVHKMKSWSIKKKVVAGIAMVVLTSSACFAAGQVTGIIGSSKIGWTQLKYSDIEKAEKEAGFEPTILKEFTNGYTFNSMEVVFNECVDEESNVLEKYKTIDVDYAKDGKPAIYVSAEQKRSYDNTREANETQEYKDITLSYFLTHYKDVPEDYELTEEDKANMERDDYEISSGSDEVSYREVSNINWELDGIGYSIMVFDTDMSTSELFDMAKEVIDAKEASDTSK